MNYFVEMKFFLIYLIPFFSLNPFFACFLIFYYYNENLSFDVLVFLTEHLSYLLFAITEKVGPGSGIVYGEVQVDIITGWILNFFGFYKEKYDDSPIFKDNCLKVSDFKLLANQMFEVPVLVRDDIKNEIDYMNFFFIF